MAQPGGAASVSPGPGLASSGRATLKGPGLRFGVVFVEPQASCCGREQVGQKWGPVWNSCSSFRTGPLSQEGPRERLGRSPTQDFWRSKPLRKMTFPFESFACQWPRDGRRGRPFAARERSSNAASRSRSPRAARRLPPLSALSVFTVPQACACGRS